MDRDKTLNLVQAAKVLGVHRDTLSKWLRTNKVPIEYERPSRGYKFKESVILSYKESRKYVPTLKTELPSKDGK